MVYHTPFSTSVPLTELGAVNAVFLGSTPTPVDPVLVWGSSIQTERLSEFVREQSRKMNLFVTPSHVLLRAVTVAIQRHPKFNRRVLRRNAVSLKKINLAMPMLRTRAGEVEVLLMHDTESMTLRDISQRVMFEAHKKAALRAPLSASEASWRKRLRSFKETLRLHWMHRMSGVGFALCNRLPLPDMGFNDVFNSASAMVNHLSYPGCPPMSFFKPSCLGMNSCHVNVTMGPSKPQAVVIDGEVAVRDVAPIFVRGDHRLVDTRDIASFLGTIRGLLEEPQSLVDVMEFESPTDEDEHVLQQERKANAV